MKKRLLLLFSIFTAFSYAQNINCSDLKTGKFKYADERLKDNITRTDSTQIEINPVDKTEIHSSVEWTSDCEYVLTYKKILNWKDDVSHVIGKKIYCEILEINGNRITVYAKGVYADGPVELIRISD